jgi:hypothetical protein
LAPPLLRGVATTSLPLEGGCTTPSSGIQVAAETAADVEHDAVTSQIKVLNRRIYWSQNPAQLLARNGEPSKVVDDG